MLWRMGLLSLLSFTPAGIRSSAIWNQTAALIKIIWQGLKLWYSGSMTKYDIKDLRELLEDIYTWNQLDIEYRDQMTPNSQMLKDRREVIQKALEIVNSILVS